MKTEHSLYYGHSKELLKSTASDCVDLIVTSPPYPMIKMWDDIFIDQEPLLKQYLNDGYGKDAFNAIHNNILTPIWIESYRVLKEGGILCINIGNAVRTLNSNFRMYDNCSRISNTLNNMRLLVQLPSIIWRKPTNSPNKFMGSGMLPVGAYITLEHEFVLIFRKGEKRKFNGVEQDIRRESAIFWEERNKWFSDVWTDLPGISQDLNNKETRKRSGAYPLDLPYRLINMFSIKGDTVLDPFLGTGTTMIAAMASERNSIGLELDKTLEPIINIYMNNLKNISDLIIKERLLNHKAFETRMSNDNKELKYNNRYHDTRVVSKHERFIKLKHVNKINKKTPTKFEVTYGK